ncbi:MAG: hypothetical protein M4579_004801 [Chaenotheca gracillima]|nr:MAG: hypothetical protein M4579_004801 [Chaenotheca gracillima]
MALSDRADPHDQSTDRRERLWHPVHGIVFSGAQVKDGSTSNQPGQVPAGLKKANSTSSVLHVDGHSQHEAGRFPAKDTAPLSRPTLAASPGRVGVSASTSALPRHINSGAVTREASSSSRVAAAQPSATSDSSDEYAAAEENSQSSSSTSGDLSYRTDQLSVDVPGTRPKVERSRPASTPYPETLLDSETRERILAYQIPEDLRQQARSAASDSEAACWRSNLYRNAEGQKPMVHWCRKKDAAEKVAQLFLSERVLGFDIEWKPQALAFEGIKRNVSVIQLASPERIALFHIALFNETTAAELIPPTLKKIIEDPEISKAGVAIRADCTRLRKFLSIEARALFELSHLYKLVKYSSGNSANVNKRLVSLAAQVEEHLELPLWKGDAVRSSDWSKPLSMPQIEYAASDSYAALHLFDAMETKRKALRPMPPCPAHAELNLPIRLADGDSIASTEVEEEPVEEGGPRRA